MTIAYSVVKTGQVLDRFGVDAEGALTFETGVAQELVASHVQRMGQQDALEMLASWSNGYVQTKEAEVKRALSLTAEECSFLDDMRAKHLPGRHNQLDHGHHGLDGSALAGLSALAGDAYQSLYGDEVDERMVMLGDGRRLGARYFAGGDIHVVLDLPDGRHQVLEETTPDAMRRLASDIDELLYTDLDETGDPYDIATDTDSSEHGFYLAVNNQGDVRIQPPPDDDDAEGKLDYLEVSPQLAGELVTALNELADSYDEDDQFTEVTFVNGSKRRKHLPGRHDQSAHGRRRNGSAVSAAARWMSPDEAMAMRQKMLADQPWPDSERNALNRYSGDAYYGMNGLLRDDQETIADLSEHQRREAEELIRDAAAGMRPTTEPVKTKRFVGGFASFGIDQDTMTREEIYDALRALKGKRSQEPGFSSMSLDENYGRAEWPGRILLELEVPAGTPAAYLDGDVGNEREQELVTIPGTVYEWDEIIIDPPRNTMKGRVVVE